jgi:hypothetical protein
MDKVEKTKRLVESVLISYFLIVGFILVVQIAVHVQKIAKVCTAHLKKTRTTDYV